MNKARLKAKWSKYCDTDKLVDDCMALLGKYNHRRSEHGTCVVLDKYFTNKESLIQQFMTSANYIGDMRIVVTADFEREIDGNAVYKFCANFCKAIDARKFLACYKDDDGKTVTDYLITGIKGGDIKGITISTKDTNKINAFTDSGTTKASETKISCFEEWIDDFKYIAEHSFSSNKEQYGVKISKGTKTSRAFHKVCTHYGIDKAFPKVETKIENGETVKKTIYPYDKLFAQYADLVADGVRHLHFVISLNPLDYLTMSFGPNWKSCHNIAGGGYMAGCVSYMLDKVSFITFAVDNLNAPIHTIPKIYRQMFYYDNNLFIQSRLYPQGKDGATDLYEKFRVLVQNEFMSILNLTENKWAHTTNGTISGVVRNFSTNTGKHYPDANGRTDCGIFYPLEKENEMSQHEPINIGHESICFNCGIEGNLYSDQLSHNNCYTSVNTVMEEPDDDEEDEIHDIFDWNL